MTKTAKVWVLPVRVLWLHSAAWIALLTFVAAQPSSEGMEPFVFEVAGRRVAEVVRAIVRRVRRVGNCMVDGVR